MNVTETWKVWRVPAAGNLEFLAGAYHKHEFAPHWHDTFVIQIVERGCNAFECAGKTYRASAGSLVLINPGEIHTGASVGNEPLCYRAIYPTDTFLIQDVLREWSHSHQKGIGFISRVVWNPPLFQLFARAHVSAEMSSDDLQTKSLLVQALCQIGLELGLSSLKASVEERPAIQKVKNFLQENYRSNISLDNLAKISGLSAYHLLRCFHKNVGMPPHQFLRNVRVERARELLSKGVPITDVAQITGFCDQSHLNRHFKRIVGLTPGQYRERTSINRNNWKPAQNTLTPGQAQMQTGHGTEREFTPSQDKSFD